MSDTSLFDTLKGRYPRTVAAFASMSNGEAALRAVAELEKRWVNQHSALHTPHSALTTQSALPPCPPQNAYDVVIAGGGLGLAAGAALAARGLRVMVFDRDRVGTAHREWNISERELGSLVKWGIFTNRELKETIATRYSRGVISFDATGTGAPYCPLQLSGVLDVALDAQRVLDLARKRFLEAGGTILEGRTFERLHIAKRGYVASVFEVNGPDGKEYYRARLAVDTMGSTSPIATALNGGLPFDGVCPTAGTVMQGLDLDPQTGDVLVSVAPMQGGRQLIWEGFPGRRGETTVYLFYYDRAGPNRRGAACRALLTRTNADGKPTGRGKQRPYDTHVTEALKQSLLDLFEQYFTLLPTYRNLHADHKHLKPVFGYIPARHGRTGKTAARGLLCLGDSAAGQSPLTFCGFGSFVRHIGRTSMLVEYALQHDLLEEKHLRVISPHQANLRVAWVFSRFMQAWPGSSSTSVNRMMNVFCKALGEAGEQVTRRFLQDPYTFGEYVRIMLTTARHEPRVFARTARMLGPAGLAKWAGDIAAFAGDSLLRNIYKLIGAPTWRAFERAATRFAPALALCLKALRTNWEAVS